MLGGGGGGQQEDRETGRGEQSPISRERVKDLDLEDLPCRQELAEVLGLKNVSQEDLSRHHCVDWLKAHEAHFSRAKTLETADLTGIPQKSIRGQSTTGPSSSWGVQV